MVYIWSGDSELPLLSRETGFATELFALRNHTWQQNYLECVGGPVLLRRMERWGGRRGGYSMVYYLYEGEQWTQRGDYKALRGELAPYLQGVYLITATQGEQPIEYIIEPPPADFQHIKPFYHRHRDRLLHFKSMSELQQFIRMMWGPGKELLIGRVLPLDKFHVEEDREQARFDAAVESSG